jgi:hypothetical protein
MLIVANERGNVSDQAYNDINYIYEPLRQDAPTLNSLSTDSYNYLKSKNVTNLEYSATRIQDYLKNTNLTSTNGEVKVTAEFVKKGLTYQPAYKTEFKADYILKNDLNEESLISFDFPFPGDSITNEISNARLLVDGIEQSNSKSKITTQSNISVDGLKWEGKIPASGNVVITVSYNTVGLSRFQYQGFDNSKGSQDFNFRVDITGIRSYNVESGLSVDQRIFADNKVSLIWNKNALYSRPSVDISVGNKISPATQVSRVYATMPFIYLPFIIGLIYLAYRFGKKQMSILDMSIITILFGVFFPLFHYFTSFTIDPTIEIFSGLNVSEYSMSLYTGFAAAFILIFLGFVYLVAKTQGFRFTLKYALPVFILSLAYFPLVSTLPEYFGLMSLLGIVFLIYIAIQVRLGSEKTVLSNK